MNGRPIIIFLVVPVIALRTLVAGATGDPTDPAVAEVKAREDDYTRGARNKDVKLLDAVFAESFIDTSETGMLINKQQYLKMLKADRSTIDSLVTDEFKIFVYGDAAVASSRFVLKGKDENGKPIEEIGRATDFWIKQNGKWMCVAAHSSPIKLER
ncbi:MAG TPA: nuclear transport factor 2 family protein [Candidatus Udaeobacter sp.]|nr:nuclear transport factor 2 family protein [Candidatus Udaeobacter sp.]